LGDDYPTIWPDVSVRLGRFAEKLAQKSRLFGIVGMTLASILFRHPFEGNFDVLATP
jgi:hypothetical protein